MFAGLLPSENCHKIGEFLLALACDVTVGHQIITTKCRKIRYPFAKVKNHSGGCTGIATLVTARRCAPLNSASTNLDRSCFRSTYPALLCSVVFVRFLFELPALDLILSAGDGMSSAHSTRCPPRRAWKCAVPILVCSGSTIETSRYPLEYKQ